jgi:hypothetical protein
LKRPWRKTDLLVELRIRQVQPGVAVEHQLVMDHLVGDIGIKLGRWQLVTRDLHRFAAEHRIDRHLLVVA